MATDISLSSLSQISSEAGFEESSHQCSNVVNSVQNVDGIRIKSDLGEGNGESNGDFSNLEQDEKTKKQKELVQNALNKALLASEIHLPDNEQENSLDSDKENVSPSKDEVQVYDIVNHVQLLLIVNYFSGQIID